MIFTSKNAVAAACLLAQAANARNLPFRRQVESVSVSIVPITTDVTSIFTVTSCAPDVTDCPGNTDAANTLYPTIAPPAEESSSVASSSAPIIASKWWYKSHSIVGQDPNSIAGFTNT